MALNKQAIPINFAQGVNTKIDPKQLPPGQFLSIENGVFDRNNLLSKRNGYGALPSLPNTSSTFLTTFNGNLTAVGNNLVAYSQGAMKWVTKGTLQPIRLSTMPLIRSNTNQSYADSAVAPNGLICTVFADVNGGTTTYKYVVADGVTGQNYLAPAAIPSTGTVTYTPKVFLLGNYFIIVFDSLISATNHLQYVAIATTNPVAPTTAVDISSQYTPASTGSFDGYSINNNLYLAWNGSDGGNAIRVTYIDSALTQHNTVVFTGRIATHMSVTADSSTSTPTVYVSFYNSGDSTGYTLAVTSQLVTVLAPTQIIASGTILNITSAATAGVCTVFYELSNNYSYDSAIPSHFIRYRTITQGGSLGTATVSARSVGLASKAFILDGTIYYLGIYYSVYQPTYFLINKTGSVLAKLAYSNAGTYYVTGLPSVNVDDDTAQVAYLFKDLVQAINKTQGATVSAGVYSQTGINLVSFTTGISSVSPAEIGNNLHLSGGFLWSYDGYQPVEHLFHLWPDNVEVTTSGSGGLITAQQYYYQVTYEWTDNQGNIFRSAPSIPVTVTTSGATSTNTINVPMLRLTYKTANPVKIVVYRWSAAQQTYYQVTSITSPKLNDVTADSIAITDTLADSAIIGNNILYTTGGVLENIAAPATSVMTLFDSRLFFVDAENENLLRFSKQVVPSVPVETSDLLSVYVTPTAPNAGANGTGPVKVLSALDDKLILFKRDAIKYISGTGPDNTGANGQYSDPVFITATVGCENPNSIAFIPNGLMFQSDKGIWLLGRDLSTSYIGAPVEVFTTGATVQSAVSVPGTNQVRFTLDTGITLMYDYYNSNWGTFTNVPAVSSTIYQNLHTYVNSAGAVFQETPNTYLDGSRPVLMKFKTGWFNLAGLQGYERAYFFQILGTYISPHKLTIQIGYDYNDNPSQTSVITPDNYSPAYGGDSLYGGSSVYGGPDSLEQWRIFFQTQKTQAFQITVTETYDASKGVAAGAGLTISGLNLVVGMKKGYKPIQASRSVG